MYYLIPSSPTEYLETAHSSFAWDSLAGLNMSGLALLTAGRFSKYRGPFDLQDAELTATD